MKKFMFISAGVLLAFTGFVYLSLTILSFFDELPYEDLYGEMGGLGVLFSLGFGAVCAFLAYKAFYRY